MEGQHFAAGPWFTVQESGQDWEELDRIYVSDGEHHRQVSVQMRLELEEVKNES